MRLKAAPAILCTVVVCAFPSLLYGRVLKEVDVQRLDSRARVRILFTRPVQPRRYFPDKASNILYISLSVPAGTRNDTSNRRERLSSFDRLQGDLPLRDVSFEPSFSEGDRLILRFRKKVSYTVKQGRDGRSINVYVDIKPSKKRKRTSDGIESNPYVINLDSKRRPIRKVKALPKFTAGYRAYTTRYVKNNKKWYRLRLGFFPDVSSANKIRKSIRSIYPRAWVARASYKERMSSRRNILSYRTNGIVTDISISSGKQPSLKGMSLAQKMKAGRQALIRGDNKKAINILSGILRQKENKHSKDALELVGLARERKGEIKQAKKIYRRYLGKYPKGDDSERVRQRLSNLSFYREPRRLRTAKSPRRTGQFQTFGTWSQRIYLGDSSQMLFTNLYTSIRSQTENVKYRANLTGDHSYNFITPSSSKGYIRKAYVEAKGKSNNFSLKLGRQSGNERGIFNRFDGVIGGYNFYSDLFFYAAAGKPVDGMAPGSNRDFLSLSIDTLVSSRDMSMSAYAIKADIDGLGDRRAVGTELRYFDDKTNLFGMVDIDTYFDDVNILMFQGNWRTSKKRSYFVLLDYRKSPLLRLSNATLFPVFGTTYDSISSLRAANPGLNLVQLAKERTTQSRLISGGVTHSLSKRAQISGDISLSEISGLPASAGQPAVPGTGMGTTLSSHIVVSNWLLKNSVSVANISLINNNTYSGTSLFFTERANINRNWRAEARLRISNLNNSNGTSRSSVMPSVKIEYHKKQKTFDFEYGQENTDSTGAAQANTINRNFVYIGYRIDF